jgi:hypothetical protein
MLDCTLRPHMLNGKRILVCEVGDWFCLPGLLGLTLLRRSMNLDEPSLSIGGSTITREILPKFRFKVAPTPARYYVRPLTLRGLSGNLIRRSRWARYEGGTRFIPPLSWRASERHRPKDGKVQLLRENDAVPPQSGDGLVQILEPWHWRWLLKMPPAMATPVVSCLLLASRSSVVQCLS